MTNSSPANTQTDHPAVLRTIEQRQTSKIMLPIELRAEAAALWTNEHRDLLSEMISMAAWAPFHRRAHEMHRQKDTDAPMPWRFHVLYGDSVTRLLNHFDAQVKLGSDEKWGKAWQSKIKDMLSACGALVQVTWLPDPSENAMPPELSRNNVEHIAAAGAAVQNLLLAAQSRQWQSYWSSGGILRDPEIFDFMGIALEEHLLGSIFLSPVVHPQCRVVSGGLREQRGDVSGWVNFPEIS